MLRLFWSHLEPITGTANLETLQTPFVCSCQKAKTESTLWLIGGPTASLKSLNPFLFLIFLLLLTSSFTLILKLLLKGPVSLSNVKIKKKQQIQYWRFARNYLSFSLQNTLRHGSTFAIFSIFRGGFLHKIPQQESIIKPIYILLLLRIFVVFSLPLIVGVSFQLFNLYWVQWNWKI